MFPRTAIIQDKPEEKTNVYFPLDKNVMQAALRELLILDNTIDYRMNVNSNTDKQTRKNGSSETAEFVPRYAMHLKKQVFEVYGPPVKKRRITKRSSVDKRETVDNPEQIVAAILARLSSEIQDQGSTDLHKERVPRKISDSDVMESSAMFMVSQRQDNDMETYVSIQENLISLTNSQDMPDFVEVSIAAEKKLRQNARRTSAIILETFSTSTLALFLGNKNYSNLTRDRLLDAIADLLFRVSHAVFAWRRTEQDFKNAGVSQDIDSQIRETLFDEASLKNIGGLENFSLLTHTLSIDRLGLSTWKEQARKDSHLFVHHKSSSCIMQAGARRRGNRLRLKGTVDIERRSRSSSFESNVTDDTGSSTAVPYLIGDIPTKTTVELERPEGKLWGVLLAKEGDVCVVVRGGKDDIIYLREGDLVIGVSNEKGELVMTPSHHGFSHIEHGDSWFESVTRMFKENRVLHVTIQRL